MTDLEKFIKNVRFAYEIQGLSQQEVAERAGITLTHFNRILRGHVPDVSARVCSAIAGAVGYSYRDLLKEPKEFMLAYQEPTAA